MINQVLSVFGAVMLLSAYYAFQRGWLTRINRTYHALNFFGASLLTYVAIIDVQVGFIIVEGTWALLSLPGTLSPPRADTPATA
jgi:hypothetical protein